MISYPKTTVNKTDKNQKHGIGNILFTAIIFA